MSINEIRRADGIFQMPICRSVSLKTNKIDLGYKCG